MSPRANRRRPPASPTGPGVRGVDLVEAWADGDWVVRPVTGAGNAKSYRCPGCDHEIRPATPHVVTWPGGAAGGPEDRRHWHKPCWAARGRRGVKVHRSRNAPHYG